MRDVVSSTGKLPLWWCLIIFLSLLAVLGTVLVADWSSVGNP